LSSENGWTWREIGQMTKYRCLVAAGAKCPEDGKLKLTPEESESWMRQRRKREADGI